MDAPHAPRPSAKIVFATLVLVLAVAGTAIAGPDALVRQVTKSKVKTIARKQADRQITRRAPGLTVANAVSADPATFAHISSTATVDAANSKGIAQSNVTVGSVAGYTCLSGLGFTPRGGVATIDFNGPNVDALVVVGLGAGTECPAGTQLFVDTRNPNGTGTLPAGFFLVVYR